MKSSVALVLAIVAVVAAQECGKLNVDVDDKNAKLPWMVQLRERTTNELVCSGTLISNQHVLIGNKQTKTATNLQLEVMLRCWL
jgi:hypothetical protein